MFKVRILTLQKKIRENDKIMKQTMKEYQENYFESNAEYKIFCNLKEAAKMFSDLFGTDIQESKRRIERESNADWIILNSGKVAVNKAIFA